MSNQSISSSEFQRFQDQLISLKEAKYKTEEKCEFLNRDLHQLESKCFILERELAKANDLKNRFKSAKDMDILMNENQALRDRLSAIEGNFKLQNDIIRTECENLFSENERLKSQIETYKVQKNHMVAVNTVEKNADTVDSSLREDHQYKIRYLQHEVTKLLEEKTEIGNENMALKDEITKLRESELELESRINSLLNEKNKIAIQLQLVKEELEVLTAVHSTELERQTSESKLQSELLVMQFDEKMSQLKEKLEKTHSLKELEAEKKFEDKVNELQAILADKEKQIEKTVEKMRRENEKLKIDNTQEISAIRLGFEEEIHENKTQLVSCERKYRDEIEQLEINMKKLQTNLDYVEEELKVSMRKNQKQLKDVKKQLEKEVKLTGETQSKLEEILSASSQNSQAKINDYLVGVNCRMSNNDDQSSLYSSSNNGLNSDLQPSLGNIGVTDDEFRILLDRLTNVQNDYCESKRYIESLKNDKVQLLKTIERQQNIILNYIKNRGGNDTDSGLNSPKQNHSTSEALILNGMMASSQSSSFGLQSLVNKVKDSLKSIASNDLMFVGDKSMCRVTTAEVKQLQRVCEELMMRCLNLETDLQLALDLNVQLNAQLSACDIPRASSIVSK